MRNFLLLLNFISCLKGLQNCDYCLKISTGCLPKRYAVLQPEIVRIITEKKIKNNKKKCRIKFYGLHKDGNQVILM